MKTTITYITFLVFCISSYSQIREGQNFCDEIKNASYFPLSKNQKLIYWYDTYYKEDLANLKNINGKTYHAYTQMWENDFKSTLYLRKEKGVIYQFEDCCKNETIRYDNSFKEGHTWKTADGLTQNKIITYNGKLKTPLCEYENLMVIESTLKDGVYNFYYFKGHGYIGATKDGKLISCVTPKIFDKEPKMVNELDTEYGKIKLPSEWEVINYMPDSKQYYLRNTEEVVIGIAINPKKNYPFYKASQSSKESVKAFYKWEYDFRTKNEFEVSKLKEDKKENYIIWKYEEKGIDNVFFYGTKAENLVNYLVYTDKWSEKEKIKFLVDLYELNQ